MNAILLQVEEGKGGVRGAITEHARARPAAAASWREKWEASAALKFGLLLTCLVAVTDDNDCVCLGVSSFLCRYTRVPLHLQRLSAVRQQHQAIQLCSAGQPCRQRNARIEHSRLRAASQEHATHESGVGANEEQLLKLYSHQWSGGGRGDGGGGSVRREHEIEGSLGYVSSWDRVEANGGNAG